MPLPFWTIQKSQIPFVSNSHCPYFVPWLVGTNLKYPKPTFIQSSIY